MLHIILQQNVMHLSPPNCILQVFNINGRKHGYTVRMPFLINLKEETKPPGTKTFKNI